MVNGSLVRTIDICFPDSNLASPSSSLARELEGCEIEDRDEKTYKEEIWRAPSRVEVLARTKEGIPEVSKMEETKFCFEEDELSMSRRNSVANVIVLYSLTFWILI